MFGLLIAVTQVRIVHSWMTRQLRMQVRRHVTELVHDSESQEATFRCDGGLARTLHLAPAAPDGEAKPPFADVIKKGGTFVFFDDNLGKSDEQEALDALLMGEGTVISSEELSIAVYEDESQQDAEKIMQRLINLTPAHLSRLPADRSPQQTLAQMIRTSQVSGLVIVAAGAVICFSGRARAANILPEASDAVASSTDP